jgi:hypothetical protein
MFRKIKEFFNRLNNYLAPRTQEEAYYNEATSLIDLEYRMALVNRGQAPWQRNWHRHQYS